jgi:hypothetical protein
MEGPCSLKPVVLAGLGAHCSLLTAHLSEQYSTFKFTSTWGSATYQSCPDSRVPSLQQAQEDWAWIRAERQSAGVLGWTKRTHKGEGHSLHLCALEGPLVQSLRPTPMQMNPPEMEAPEAGWQYCILFWCQL